MSSSVYKPLARGRGSLDNPTGRFEKLSIVPEIDDDFPDEDALHEQQVKTSVYLDSSKAIIATNDSPDNCIEASVNPYRGCEHGCIYCYARPGHEYFGLSAGIDFETKIFAKPDAPALLRDKLLSRSWKPKVITMSGVTDPYQPLESTMKITLGCLEVLRDFRNPVAIITKNHLVTRDLEILKEMASYNAAIVNISITTLEGKLSRNMEPRASAPHLRLRAVETLSKAGIPVNVMIGPVLPGLTEQEIPSILENASSAGACSAGYTMMRLPHAVKDIFQTWLAKHYPDRVNKVINRIKEVRGGKLNDARFGTRMRGEGFYADQIEQIFDLSRKRFGLTKKTELSTNSFRRVENKTQLQFSF